MGLLGILIIRGIELIQSGFDIMSMDERVVVEFSSFLIGLGGFIIGRKQRSINKSETEKEYAIYLKNVFSYEPKARKQLLQAIVLYRRDKFRRAIRMLHSLLKKCHTNNDLSAVHLFIALCYDEQELWTPALEHYQKVIRYNPASDTALSNAGRLYHKKGNLDEALDCFHKAIAINSENALAYNNMAYLYLETFELDNAIEAANEALRIRQNFCLPMYVLALAYTLKNEKQTAEKYFQQSVINGYPDVDNLRAMMNQMADVN